MTTLVVSNIVSVLLGFSMSIFLLPKLKQSIGSRLALVILVALSLRSFVMVNVELSLNWHVEYLMALSAGMQFVMPYFIVQYLKWMAKPNEPLKWNRLHFILPILVFVYVVLYQAFDWRFFNSQLTYFQNMNRFQSGIGVPAIFSLWLISALYYSIEMGRVILAYNRNSSEFPNVQLNLKGLNYLVAIYYIIVLLFLGVVFAAFLGKNSLIWIMAGSLMKPLYMAYLFFLRVTHPRLLLPQLQVFESIDSDDLSVWRFEPISGEEARPPHHRYEQLKTIQELVGQIERWVETNLPFRDSGFSLEELSKELNLPETHLRYLFKEHCKLSFNDFRNFHRVKDLAQIMIDPACKHLGFEAMGELCGFGSKSAMFRAVRRHYNMTPQELYYSLK